MSSSLVSLRGFSRQLRPVVDQELIDTYCGGIIIIHHLSTGYGKVAMSCVHATDWLWQTDFGYGYDYNRLESQGVTVLRKTKQPAHHEVFNSTVV